MTPNVKYSKLTNLLNRWHNKLYSTTHELESIIEINKLKYYSE